MDLNRIPVIALEYVNESTAKEDAISKELLIDYNTGDIYIKNTNGDIVSCTSKYANISDRQVTLSDGTTGTLKEILDAKVGISVGTETNPETLKDLSSEVIKVNGVEFIPKTTIRAVYNDEGETLLDELLEIKQYLAKQILVSSQSEIIRATEDNQKVFNLTFPVSEYNFAELNTTLVFNGITFYDSRHYDIVGSQLIIKDELDGIPINGVMKDRELTVIYIFNYYPKDYPNSLSDYYDGRYVLQNSITIDKLANIIKTLRDLNESGNKANSIVNANVVYEILTKLNEVNTIATDAKSKALSHRHDYATIESVDSAKILNKTGTISIDCLPEAVKKRLHIVADYTAMYNLTTDEVLLYDFVKVSNNGSGNSEMFLVIDTANLNNSAGYERFDNGVVDWSNIENKPNSLSESGIQNTITTNINSHDSNTSSHSDIRTSIAKVQSDLTTLTNNIDTQQLAELIEYVGNNEEFINQITSKVNKSDIVDNLTSTNIDKPLSANQGKVLKALIDAKVIPTALPANGGNADTVDNKHASDFAGAVHTHTDKVNVSDIVDSLTSTVASVPLSANQGRALKALIDAKVIPTALPANGGNADTVDNKHASDFAEVGHTHAIASTTINGFMSKEDKVILDNAVTTLSNKVNTSDILDILTSTVTTKPLSANQGRVLKALIDTNIAAIATKANASDILTKTNTTAYTPTEDYHPATVQYVKNNNFSDTFAKTTTSTANDTIKVSKIINAAKGIKMDNGTTLVHNAATIIDSSGIVYNAAYNDIAEAFETEDISILEPGDVITIGDNGKYSKSKNDSDRTVVGVYSDTYGQLLGADGADNLEEKGLIPVGLAGRVYVKVTGTAKIGDLLVSSEVPGVAHVNNNPTIGTVIGKVLENKDTDEISRIRMLIMNS